MLLYCLNLADLVSTLVILHNGGVELNPVMNVIIAAHPALFALVKIAAFPLCRWLAKQAIVFHSAKVGYIGAVAVYAGIVAWNLGIIFILFRGR